MKQYRVTYKADTGEANCVLDPNDPIFKMKEEQLNEAANMKVIFGTYPMASEGLDIPSLNTLLLVTPKSNVVQSVGRILRKDFDNIFCFIYLFPFFSV